MPIRIISGGQTGVDRAALDAAAKAGLESGGWCPLGRRAEDGRISDRYPLSETPSESYEERTAWNVRDADGTLVILDGEADAGTDYTIKVAKQMRRPLLVIDLENNVEPDDAAEWAKRKRITVLNVAGPRESSSPGIYDRALPFLAALFGKLR